MAELAQFQRHARIRVCIVRLFGAIDNLEDGIGFLDRDPVYSKSMIEHMAFKVCQQHYPDDLIREAAAKVCAMILEPAEAPALPPFPERLHWHHSGWTNGKGDHVGISGKQLNDYMDAAEAFRDAVVQR